MAWLSGCAAAPPPAPTACVPSRLPVAVIVAAAEKKAYHDGFRAGERAQWWHDKPELASAAPKPPPAPAPKPAPVLSSQAADPPKNIFYPAGPALPVQGSANPF
jgi:hypothetical protein